MNGDDRPLDCLDVNEATDSYLRQIARQKQELARLRNQLNRIHDYGIDTRSFGDGDANAAWNRVDAFRNDPEAVLDPEDVRELAEWWAELHTTVSELDEKLCQRDAEIANYRGFFDLFDGFKGKSDDKPSFDELMRAGGERLANMKAELARLRAVVGNLHELLKARLMANLCTANATKEDNNILCRRCWVCGPVPSELIGHSWDTVPHKDGCPWGEITEALKAVEAAQAERKAK